MRILIHNVVISDSSFCKIEGVTIIQITPTVNHCIRTIKLYSIILRVPSSNSHFQIIIKHKVIT